MFYIVKKNYGDTAHEFYYTGLDDPELIYTTNFSDAETFNSMEICFLTYEALRAKMNEKDNTDYYIFVDSTGVNEWNEKLI